RVHHNGAIPGDRFFNRFAGYQEEANSFWSGLDRDLVATIKQHQRVILDVVDGRGFRSMDLFRQDSLRIGSIAKTASAGEYVGECIAPRVDFQPFALVWRNGDVEVTRLGRHAIDGAFPAPELAANDPNLSAIVIGDLGNRA